MRRSIRIFCIEFIQNLPMLAGFFLAWTQVRSGNWQIAILYAFLGALLGALTIWRTEVMINPEHREPLSVVVANIIVLTALICLFIYYLSTAWSSWLTDIALAGSSGILLGSVQSIANRKRVDIVHCIALASAFPLTLIVIRVLTATQLPLLAIVLVGTLIVTAIIVAIDYYPLYTQSTTQETG